MGDKINIEFEKFQDELKIRRRKIKYIPKFEMTNLDDVLNDLKQKEITL